MAHLTAAVADAKRSPGGLMMPNPSLLYKQMAVFNNFNMEPQRELVRKAAGLSNTKTSINI
nr:hypothetical protein [Priestia megaterium]